MKFKVQLFINEHLVHYFSFSVYPNVNLHVFR